jgi:hypothetical protein
MQSKYFKPDNIEKYFFIKPMVIHPTLMAKSEILKTEKYDINNRYAEDFELWLRLISKKYVFEILEEVLLQYKLEILPQKILTKYSNYSKYAIKAFWKNRAYYWNNIYAIIRVIYDISIYIITKLPSKKLAQNSLNIFFNIKYKILKTI